MILAVGKRGGQIVPLVERLERRSTLLTECGCQIWLGYLDDAGYGLMRVGKTIKRAHRSTIKLGKLYSISKSMVSNIKRGANWND